MIFCFWKFFDVKFLFFERKKTFGGFEKVKKLAFFVLRALIGFQKHRKRSRGGAKNYFCQNVLFESLEGLLKPQKICRKHPKK